jgi:hypothetical protein
MHGVVGIKCLPTVVSLTWCSVNTVLCPKVYHPAWWKERSWFVMICFRLNQMNVWAPFTAHVPLKVLLVGRVLSLLWLRMNQKMTHSVNRVSVCQMDKFQQGKYKNVLHNIFKSCWITCVLYPKYNHYFSHVILMCLYNTTSESTCFLHGFFLKVGCTGCNCSYIMRILWICLLCPDEEYQNFLL